MTRNRAITSSMHHNQSDSNVLRSPGWLAARPMIGVLMFVLGGLLFGALAYNVETKGPLLQWDAPLAQEMHTEAAQTPIGTLEYLIFGFFLGKELIQVIAGILVLYFLHKRFWRELAMVLVGLGGGGYLWYLLSRYFERLRPSAQLGIVVTDPSFPSGHTIAAVLCYGLLAYLLVPKMPSTFWKVFVIVVALFAIAFIGFSRLFLGGHYLTDIVAGYALGIAWAGLVYTVLEKIL